MPVDFNARIDEWREQLLDLSKRNRLINCRVGSRGGAIRLEHPSLKEIWTRLVLDNKKLTFVWRRDLLDAETAEEDSDVSLLDDNGVGNVEDERSEFEQCLESPRLLTNHVLTQMPDKSLGSRLYRFSLNARTSLTEQGINNLFLAFGLLRWYESVDSEKALLSPLALVPVELSRANADSPWVVSLHEEEVVPNHSLAQILESSFALKLPSAPDDDQLDTEDALGKYFADVASSIEHQERWQIVEQVVLGTFSFQKVAMWNDLGHNRERVLAHDVCRAIAGDEDIDLAGTSELLAPSEFDDRVSPSDVNNILNCDSSQLEAILAAKSGTNLVLDGPPGTGKSQTIANIIAEFLADGKTVLFVSEKAAALEVVKRRLDSRNLGDFCLECHSHKASKREIIAELGRCLELGTEQYRDDAENREQLHLQRTTLNTYVRALHTPVSALKITPYYAHGRLAAVSDAKRSQFNMPDVLATSQSELRQLTDALGRLGACRQVVENGNVHPWRGCLVEGNSLTILDDVVGQFQDLIHTSQHVLESVEDLQVLEFLNEQPTRRDIERAVAMVREATTYPSIPHTWFTSDPKAVANTIIKMKRDADICRERRHYLSHFRSELLEGDGIISRLEAFSSKEAQDWSGWLRLPSPASVKTLLGELQALADDLSYLRKGLDTCSDAFGNLARLLHVTLGDTQPIRAMPKLTAIARCVADIEKARPSWFVSEERENLKTVAAQCVKELCDIEEVRGQLSNCFVPEAFDTKGAEVAVDANRFQPAWEEYAVFRKRFAGFYTGEPPRSMKQLLSDMKEFREYATKKVRLGDVAAEDTDRLLLGEDDNPDWQSMSDIAGAIRKLRGMMKLPDQLEMLADDWLCDQLFSAAKDCKAATVRATRLRGDLLSSFAPIAFDAPGREKVEDLDKYERFWRRWSAEWREYRDQVRDLFSASRPRSGRRLIAKLKKLRNYHHCCISVESAAHEYSEVLPYTASNAVDWDVLEQALEAVGKLKMALNLSNRVRDWLNGATLSELQRLIDRRMADQARVCGLRESLRNRFSRDSLDDCDLELADQIKTHIRFLRRWRHCKSEALTKLYGGTPPKSSRRIFQDLGTLEAYHTGVLRLRQKSQEHADATISNGSNIADWPVIAKRLASVEQLASLIRIPSSVIAALSRPKGVDRQAIIESAARLDSALASVGEDIPVFCDRFPSLPMTDQLRDYMDSGPIALCASAQEQAARIDRHLRTLDGVVELLRADADMSSEDVAKSLKKVVGLRETECLARTRAERLEGIIDLSVDPCSRDWLEEADKAKWLLTFLSQHDGPPPNAIMQIITDQDVRIEAAKAVKRAEDAFSAQFRDSWQYLAKLFSLSDEVSTGIRIESTPLVDLVQWLKDRCGDVKRLYEWTEFRTIEDTLRRYGVTRLLEDVKAGNVALDGATQALEARFFRLWLDAVYRKDPTLELFSADGHERVVHSFREMDRKVIDGGYKRIRTQLLQDPRRPHIGLLNAPASSETGVLLKEVNKRKRHLSLRQLFKRIPGLITRLKPCIMMSPLSVSTYLDSDHISFDLVIFDEASQVRPYDAIGAVYRGKQLVVAGDQKQLPPTTFFDKLSSDGDSAQDDEEYVDSIADFESILDVCCTKGVPRKRLRWHYRSRREPLIAFSNRYFYNNELITFPSIHDVDGQSAVRHEFVADGQWLGGSSGGYNPVEAKRVAELVVEHFRKSPRRSLGVVAFNQRQHLAILDELEKLRRRNPAIEHFFDEKGEEPFFVKNLENVQGDERDVIVISVGYGHDADGKFAMRFGPLNRQGGERRLNVIVTRAKYEVVLVTSIRSHDIDVRRTQSVGVRLLKSYLEYAERGVEALTSDIQESSEDEYDSPFEMEVARALRSRDLKVETQVGCAGYRIDLALVDPDHPGRYVLAVECDGATYHSTVTARDRDRLRQEVLESLGWTIVRIWSTEWVRNPDRQIERIVSSYERVLTSFTEDYEEPFPVSKHESHDKEEPIVTVPGQEDPSNGLQEYYYDSIDEVPDEVVYSLAVSLLRTYGATDEGEVVRSIARLLGFRRTGKHIRQRIEACVETLKDLGILQARSEGLLSLDEERFNEVVEDS